MLANLRKSLEEKISKMTEVEILNAKKSIEGLLEKYSLSIKEENLFLIDLEYSENKKSNLPQLRSITRSTGFNPGVGESREIVYILDKKVKREILPGSWYVKKNKTVHDGKYRLIESVVPIISQEKIQDLKTELSIIERRLKEMQTNQESGQMADALRKAGLSVVNPKPELVKRNSGETNSKEISASYEVIEEKEVLMLS